MCDPSYPILRSGLILSSDRVLDGEEAVRLAQTLADQQQAILAVFSQRVAEHWPGTDRPKAATGYGSDALRLRFSPTITLDLPPVVMMWEDIEIESRACLTVCAGDRRGKLWQRMNSNKTLTDKTKIGRLLTYFEELSSVFETVWLGIYNEYAARLRPAVVFDRSYELRVIMTSLSGHA